MLGNLFRLIRQQDYVDYLKSEIETLRAEKFSTQDTLNRVLKIHLIPKDRTELVQANNQPVRVPMPATNNIRQRLNEMQMRSYDEVTRAKLAQVTSQKIDEIEEDLDKVGNE